MLFKCLPPGAQIPGRFPGPAHARGKWFTVDIHCHVLTPKAAEMVAGSRGCDAASAGGIRQRAHPRGQPRAGGAHPHPVHLGREAARRHGPDGDRHPGDLAVAEPDLLWRRPRSRHRDRAGRQRQPRRHRRPSSRPLCRARHGAVPGARARGRRARPAAQIARLSRHRDRHQCRRRGFLGRAVPQDLRAHRGARAADLHAPDRLSRGAALCRPLPRQRDRQPARLDRRGASPDLWRRAARPSQPEARHRAWRRLSAGLFRPHRPRRGGAARLLRDDQPDADRPI